MLVHDFVSLNTGCFVQFYELHKPMVFLAGKTIEKSNKKDAKMDRTLDESSEALCPKVYVIQKFFFSLAIQIKTN